MRLKTPIIALSTVAMLALAACGGDGDDESSDNPTVDASKLGDTGDAQDPTREGPKEIEGATEGGTVTVLSAAGLNTMDPSEAYYTNTGSILSQLVVRSLTQYDYDPESGQMVLIPDLATDLGTHNDDYTEWSFTLRDGITYENGDPVTAEDMKYGMERGMDRTAFPDGATYSNDFFEGGADFQGPITDPGATLDSITVDGNTVTIKMAKPFPDMAYWAAFAQITPIPKEGSDPAQYRLHPLATGPYKFADYTPEKSLTLVRNEEWDPATDPGRTQYPDSYDMTFDAQSEQIDTILLGDQGEAQTTLSFDDVLSTDLRRFQSEAQDRLVPGGQPCTFYFGPDYRKVKELEVRQALGFAYPYKEAALAGGLIYGVNAIPGNNIMPPGVPGREDYQTFEGVEPGTTDPARSKELLAEAGYEPGEYEIRWLFAADDNQAVAIKDAIKAGLEAGGFKATPVPTTVEELSTVRSDPNADINVRRAGWCSDWPSGGSWFPPIIETTDVEGTGLGSNYTVFSEPDVDAKIAEIQMLPIEEQPAAWNELDEEIQSTYYPMVIERYAGVLQMRGSKIMGHNIDNTFGMPTWKDIWVQQ